METVDIALASFGTLADLIDIVKNEVK